MKKTPEQKAEASRKQKEHIALLKWVSEIIEIPYIDVAAYWSRLKEEGLLEDGNLVVIRARLQQLRGNPTEVDKGESNLKMALWFINKCGGLEAAQSAFDIAGPTWLRTRDKR